MNKRIICPKCDKNNVIKWCKRKTQNRGAIQRYKCKDCGSYFTLDDGFFRMRNAPQKITLCLDLFFRGVSTRKVQEHLQAFYPHNSSNVSIYRWIIKYSKIIARFTDKLRLNVGCEMQVDEMEYATKGFQSWFIDCMDTTTKFIVSSNYCKSRGEDELRAVLRLAKRKTERQVKLITTDGLLAYPKAIHNSFLLKKWNRYGVIHQIRNATKGDGFNYPIERLHNNIRARTKTFRGFHGSVESANSIMKGLEIYYNFIRKHLAINKCPYECATDLRLTSNNKWLELINLSKR